MSGLIEKIKDAVHGDKHHSSSNDPASAKGHDSHAANKADPRIDSDRDGRANPLSNTTGTHTTGTHTGTTGHSSGAGLSGVGSGTHTTGTHTGAGLSGVGSGTHTTGSNTLGSSTHNTSTNAGPHSSNLANKADPRVDSDRDHRANPTSGGLGSTGGEFGSSRTAGTGEFGSTTRSGAEYGNTGGLGSSNTAYGNTSTNAGPHDSNLANKADPRVDSDRDHRGNPTSGGLGSNTGAYGTTGSHNTHGTTGGLGSSNTAYGNTSTNAGPHDSNIANKADPRVDSDRDHRANPASGGIGSNTGAYGSSTTGSHTTGAHTGTHGTHGAAGLNNPGPAPNTAGPHSKDILNKVDPRVDSDRDGSKTVGQDQTYARSSNTTTAHRDPTDAAQVPPSVLAKHIGEPAVHHDDHSHDRARRNSATPHQEAHRGL